MSELMIDYQTIKENTDVMRKCRDAIGNTPDLEELLFVKHLSEDNQTLISGICAELSNAYTVLDVCSYGIDVLTSENIPKHETVEQWEARTGETYPDDAPVYLKERNKDSKGYWYFWRLTDYKNSKPYASVENLKKWIEANKNNFIVATHHGKPNL